MNNLQEVMGSFGTKTKRATSTNKKIKWREIEQLKDKFQLEKELRAFEDSLDHMLEEF